MKEFGTPEQLVRRLMRFSSSSSSSGSRVEVVVVVVVGIVK